MKPRRKVHSLNEQSLYDKYYSNQAGSGLPFYSGTRVQSGYGLGSILGGLLRSAVPLLKPALKSVGKEVARSGVGVIKDVMQGQSLKQAAKRRLQEGAQRSLRAATGVVLPSFVDTNPRRKSKRRKKTPAAIKRGSRQTRNVKFKRDIFR